MTNPSIYSATAPSGPWLLSNDASLHSSLSSACFLHPRVPRTYSASLLARSSFCLLSVLALAPSKFSRHPLFIFTEWDLFHKQPPTRRTRAPLFVCVITFDLSYLASSYSSTDTACWLGLRIRIPPGVWLSVSCECWVLSGRGLCDGPIACPEESYRVWCVCVWSRNLIEKFWYFVDRASQYIYLNINQLDELNFIMSLFHASTCFEYKCSSSGGQNCTIQSLVSSHP